MFADLLPSLENWLLTYLLHSTLFISSVWLVTRLKTFRSKTLQDLLWKIALTCGVISCTFQVGGGMMPITGRYELFKESTDTIERLRLLEASEMRLLSRHTDEVEISGLALGSLEKSTFFLKSDDPSNTTVIFVPSRVKGHRPMPVDNLPETESSKRLAKKEDAGWRPSISTLLIGFWLLGVALTGIRLSVGRRRLDQRISGGREIVNGPLAEQLSDLSSRAGMRRTLRLTLCRQIMVPMALSRRRICIPERAMKLLSPAQQESMLAHEIAHVARKDPQWLLLANIIECLFFFQPLNLVARRHLQESSEYLCDDWTVRHTGHERALAECIWNVVSWTQERSGLPAIACMAQSDSPFILRIKRLLDLECQHASEMPRMRRWLLVFALLSLSLFFAPNISTQAPAVAEWVWYGALALLTHIALRCKICLEPCEGLCVSGEFHLGF